MLSGDGDDDLWFTGGSRRGPSASRVVGEVEAHLGVDEEGCVEFLRSVEPEVCGDGEGEGATSDETEDEG